MMTYGIPSFRLEKDVVNAEIEVLRDLGVDILCGVNVGDDLTLDDLRKEGYQGFYVAIGAQGGRKLGVPGETESHDVLSGIDFLRNVAYNEQPDLPEKVVVIGSGNVAIDVARTALRKGGKDITMLCLESREEMPAAADEVADTEAEGIKVECGWGPKEIKVENGHVTSIVMKRCTRVRDETGRFNPAYDENDTMEIPCNAVLAAIGQSIEWGNLLKGSKVVVGRGGRAEADSWTYQTAEPDIFVGGDVYTCPRFLIDAIAAHVDTNICIGCGLCTVQCKFDAIHLTRDYAAFGADYEHLVPAVLQEMGRKTVLNAAKANAKFIKKRPGWENIHK